MRGVVRFSFGVLDVRQLRGALHDEDVPGADIAVHPAVLVQDFEG